MHTHDRAARNAVTEMLSDAAQNGRSTPLVSINGNGNTVALGDLTIAPKERPTMKIQALCRKALALSQSSP